MAARARRRRSVLMLVGNLTAPTSSGVRDGAEVYLTGAYVLTSHQDHQDQDSGGVRSGRTRTYMVHGDLVIDCCHHQSDCQIANE